jgi:hypothetical protein
MARMLMLYISTGLFFMLLPGTFPGGLGPAGDQRQPGGELGIANMDSGAGSRVSGLPALRLAMASRLGGYGDDRGDDVRNKYISQFYKAAAFAKRIIHRVTI